MIICRVDLDSGPRLVPDARIPMKPFLPLVLVAALVPGAPAHAAPASPFKVLKRSTGWRAGSS